MHADYTMQETLCTVHRTHNHFIQKKIYIKNESHGIIYTFKNYFATVFSVFSCIQTDPKYSIRGMDLIVSTNSQCNESIIALITIVKN